MSNKSVALMALEKLAAPELPSLPRVGVQSFVQEFGRSSAQKTVDRLYPKQPLMQQLFGQGGVGRKAVALGALAALAGVAGELGERAVRAFGESRSREKGFKDFSMRFPDQAKADGAREAFETLHRFAPQLAKDPEVTRGFVRRQLQFKEEGPQVMDIKTLADINKSLIDARKASSTALSSNAGIRGGLEAFKPDKLKLID